MSNQSVNTEMCEEVKVKIDLEKNNTSSVMSNQMEQPNYPNCLTIEQMKELDLFDNLKYGEVKGFGDDYDIEVEITDLECDIARYNRTSFKFDLEKEHEVILEYHNDGYVYNKLQEWIEEQDEADEENYEDHAKDMKDEPIGDFNCCDIEIFESDYPTREFKELQEELEINGFLECLIHEPLKEAKLDPCYSEISISIGSNERVIRTIYNTSSPFAAWLCGLEFMYFQDRQESEDEDEEE